MHHALPTLVIALALATVARVASADIYAYTDSAGTTHFSNVPNDSRYQLIVHSPAQPGVAGPAMDPRRVSRWLARSADYDVAIRHAALASNVRPALLRAVIVVESGFNPRAISRRGAIGLMQLLPTTARRYGAFNAFDPEQNIRAGARYLSDLITRFGDNRLELVLAAYNAGAEAVQRYGNHIPPFRETQGYVPNVLRMYRALQQQSDSTAEDAES